LERKELEGNACLQKEAMPAMLRWNDYENTIIQQEKWKTKSEYVSGFSFQDAVMHLDAIIISTPAGSYTSKYETIEKK